MIIPFGHKIIVKKITEEKTKAGIILPENTSTDELRGNAWGEIIALPDHRENPFINLLSVGMRVLYRPYSNDLSKDKDGNDFEIIEVERDGGQGRIMAYEKNKQ